jgi:hypothetical protein
MHPLEIILSEKTKQTTHSMVLLYNKTDFEDGKNLYI